MENNYRICKPCPESQKALSVPPNSSEDDVPDDDDISLFDIDFTLPLCCDGPLKDPSSPCTDKEDSEEEIEFNFCISTSNQPNPSQCISPADNLFYKGHMHPLQVPPTEDVIRKLEVDDGNGSLQSSNANGIKTQFPTLLKTATKLKISLFGLTKSAKVGMDLQASCGEYGGVRDSAVQKQNKFFTLKFKVMDVPLVSLFTRYNSRGAKGEENNNGVQKKSESDGDIVQCKSNDRDKQRAKEIVQKYTKMIKPLYVKISQRYNEKAGTADLEKARNGARSSGFSCSEKSQNQLSFSDNLKMVYKHLGKGRNSSSNVNNALPNYNNGSTMMELQSAIQGAIAHCKQSSYNDGAPNSSDVEGSL